MGWAAAAWQHCQIRKKPKVIANYANLPDNAHIRTYTHKLFVSFPFTFCLVHYKQKQSTHKTCPSRRITQWTYSKALHSVICTYICTYILTLLWVCVYVWSRCYQALRSLIRKTNIFSLLLPFGDFFNSFCVCFNASFRYICCARVSFFFCFLAFVLTQAPKRQRVAGMLYIRERRRVRARLSIFRMCLCALLISWRRSQTSSHEIIQVLHFHWGGCSFGSVL